jgi:type III secretory pathway component EscU
VKFDRLKCFTDYVCFIIRQAIAFGFASFNSFLSYAVPEQAQLLLAAAISSSLVEIAVLEVARLRSIVLNYGPILNWKGYSDD